MGSDVAVKRPNHGLPVPNSNCLLILITGEYEYRYITYEMSDAQIVEL